MADLAHAQRWVLPVWLLAYGMKIYFDFSAYSDIAIGSARLFGIKVPENFDWPYIRTNIASFWQHWHMSLYSWLVDYVFIPLGGSRTTQPRVYLNVLITMAISGLWHGAGLNFICWGLWHGALLTMHRLWLAMRGPAVVPSRFGQVAAWALTFVTVNLGWAFFCMDLPTAIFFFRRLFLG
jgi:alginate O-acetyltransferase complex protein AlgI